MNVEVGATVGPVVELVFAVVEDQLDTEVAVVVLVLEPEANVVV